MALCILVQAMLAHFEGAHNGHVVFRDALSFIMLCRLIILERMLKTGHISLMSDTAEVNQLFRDTGTTHRSFPRICSPCASCCRLLFEGTHEAFDPCTGTFYIIYGCAAGVKPHRTNDIAHCVDGAEGR